MMVLYYGAGGLVVEGLGAGRSWYPLLTVQILHILEGGAMPFLKSPANFQGIIGRLCI